MSDHRSLHAALANLIARMDQLMAHRIDLLRRLRDIAGRIIELRQRLAAELGA